MEEVGKVEQEVGRVVQGPAAERKKPAVGFRKKSSVEQEVGRVVQGACTEARAVGSNV